MAAHNLILVEKLCSHYEIEITFFNALHKIGLIEIETIERKQFIHQDQISALEKIIRLHHQLDVNIEGIDIVFNLLQKLDELRNELKSVKNRLKLYESDE